MRLRTAVAALTAAERATAFQGTSPFFLYSTPPGGESRQQILATAEKVESQAQNHLVACNSDFYVFVDQPGVTSTDFGGKINAPHLQRWMESEGQDSHTSYAVANVVGGIDLLTMSANTVSSCGAQISTLKDQVLPATNLAKPHIITITLPALPQGSEERAAAFTKNDAYISSVVDELKSDSYTVVYGASEHRSSRSTQDDPYPFVGQNRQAKLVDPDELGKHSTHARHVKRDTDVYPRKAGNETLDDVGVFEKYEFLSPAIFMGGMTALLLLAILSVGIRAIAGLEVSYMAFNKEMGPSAQKKQQ